MILKKEFYERYKKNNGWVYLVNAEGTPRLKIGRSINPVTRLSQLQGQSPYPLVIQDCIWTPDAIYYEQCLHQEFSEYRVFGEWFEFVELTGLLNVHDKFSWYGRTDICEISHSVSRWIIDEYFETKLFCDIEGFTRINSIVQKALATSQNLDDLVCTIDFFLKYLFETWISKKFNTCCIYEEFLLFSRALKERTDCFIHGLHRGNIYEFIQH